MRKVDVGRIGGYLASSDVLRNVVDLISQWVGNLTDQCRSTRDDDDKQND